MRRVLVLLAILSAFVAEARAVTGAMEPESPQVFAESLVKVLVDQAPGLPSYSRAGVSWRHPWPDAALDLIQERAERWAGEGGEARRDQDVRAVTVGFAQQRARPFAQQRDLLTVLGRVVNLDPALTVRYDSARQTAAALREAVRSQFPDERAWRLHDACAKPWTGEAELKQLARAAREETKGALPDAESLIDASLRLAEVDVDPPYLVVLELVRATDAARGLAHARSLFRTAGLHDMRLRYVAFLCVDLDDGAAGGFTDLCGALLDQQLTETDAGILRMAVYRADPTPAVRRATVSTLRRLLPWPADPPQQRARTAETLIRRLGRVDDPSREEAEVLAAFAASAVPGDRDDPESAEMESMASMESWLARSGRTPPTPEALSAWRLAAESLLSAIKADPPADWGRTLVTLANATADGAPLAAMRTEADEALAEALRRYVAGAVDPDGFLSGGPIDVGRALGRAFAGLDAVVAAADRAAELAGRDPGAASIARARLQPLVSAIATRALVEWKSYREHYGYENLRVMHGRLVELEELFLPQNEADRDGVVSRSDYRSFVDALGDRLTADWMGRTEAWIAARAVRPEIWAPVSALAALFILFAFYPASLLSTGALVNRVGEAAGAIPVIGRPLEPAISLLRVVVLWLDRSPRVLDDYTRRRLEAARTGERWLNRFEACRGHAPSPVSLNRTPGQTFTEAFARASIARVPLRLLILGPGGVGKTSIALRLGDLAMRPEPEARLLASRPCLSLVIRPGDRFDQPGTAGLIRHAAEMLKETLALHEPPPVRLTEALLRKGRILVIIDDWDLQDPSVREPFEKGSDIVPRLLIVTARRAPAGSFLTSTLEPRPMRGETLVAFLENCLLAAGVGDAVVQANVLRLGEALRTLVGADGEVTALLARSFADIAARELRQTGAWTAPRDVPGLMLRYALFFTDRLPEEQRGPTLADARALSAACVVQRGAVDWVDAAAVQTALGADGAARADRLAESGLLVSLPGGSGRVKIAPDPLAEHLAALRFASDLRNDLTAWASHLDGLVERAVKAETGAQLLGLLDALDRVARSDPDEVLTPETRAGMHRLIGAARSKLTPAAPP